MRYKRYKSVATLSILWKTKENKETEAFALVIYLKVQSIDMTASGHRVLQLCKAPTVLQIVDGLLEKGLRMSDILNGTHASKRTKSCWMDFHNCFQIRWGNFFSCPSNVNRGPSNVETRFLDSRNEALGTVMLKTDHYYFQNCVNSPTPCVSHKIKIKRTKPV